MAGRIDTDREAMDLLIIERHVNGDVTHGLIAFVASGLALNQPPRRLSAGQRGTDPAPRAGRVSYTTGGCDRP